MMATYFMRHPFFVMLYRINHKNFVQPFLLFVPGFVPLGKLFL